MSTVEAVSTAVVSVSSAVVKAAAAFVVKPTARQRQANNPAALVSGKVRIFSSDGYDSVHSIQRAPISSEKPTAFFSAFRQTHPAGHYGNLDVESYFEAENIGGLVKSGFDSLTIGENYVEAGAAKIPAESAPAAYMQPSPDRGRLLGKYRLSAADLFSLVSDVGAAADTETSRYALGGLYFESEADTFESGFSRLHVVGTDGKRMHVRTFSDFNPALVPDESGAVSALVPVFALSALVKSVKATLPSRFKAGAEPSVVLEFFDNGAGFSWIAGGWNYFVFTPRMDGRFPKWREIFTAHKPTETAWFSAYFGELSAAVSAAAAGVCKETKERVFGLDFGHGAPCPSGGERMPRLSAKTPAGEFSADLKYGAVSGGFCVKLDTAFVLDGLPKSVFADGFGNKHDGALVRMETDGADFLKDNGRPWDSTKTGTSAVFVKHGGGIEARNGIGWSAVIMPLAAD